MKKTIAIIIILFLVFIVYNQFFKRETQILKYSELPESVKSKFIEITNTSYFVMIGNTNANCLTNATSAGIPNFFPLIKIKTCDSKHYISFTDTTIRAFVIDGENVYYIYEDEVWSREFNRPNSNFFQLDTLNFKKVSKK